MTGVRNAVPPGQGGEEVVAHREAHSEHEAPAEHGLAATRADDIDRAAVRGVMFDIAEPEEIESRGWEAEAKYQALVEQIPAVLYIDLPEHSYKNAYVSPQIERILGITPESYTNGTKTWIELLHPEDRERVLQQYERFLSGGPDIDDYRIVRPDGRTVWIRDRATLYRDPEGTLVEQGVMFDVTEQKEAEAIIRNQVELLKKVDVIGREFTDLLLHGTQIEYILEGLERITGYPVALEDAAHQVIGFAGDGDALDPVLATWENHSRERHAEGERARVRVEEGSPRCAWTTIWLRDGAWGRLHMLEVGRPVEEIDLLALDRAAAAVGLTLLSEREAANLAENAGSALIMDAFHGRYASSAEVLRRAKGLGADFAGGRLVAMALELSGLADRDLSELERQRVRALVLREVKAAAKAAGCVALAALERDLALCLVGMPKEANITQVVDRIGAELVRRLGERTEGLDVSVGASREAEQDSLRHALEEASEAAAYATRTGVHGVQHFADLGVHHLLARLADGPDLARFVESQLASLLAHDAKGSSPLLPTLRAFLDKGGAKSATARALHLERMSLYHRLGRIERLLGRDLDDSDTRTQLDMALRGLEILRKRSSRARASV